MDTDHTVTAWDCVLPILAVRLVDDSRCGESTLVKSLFLLEKYLAREIDKSVNNI